ncbi:alpha/beta hydrolase [Pseudomonas oryzihabitans]|uniref:alpha/beta fold hydrolase n=1 Tax=Pseudomonas oryzihabitans TaxID=47885 RepID=UPI002B1D51AE|nr:alpha/beta hydrolase [Pseudomonas oryzihabitans]
MTSQAAIHSIMPFPRQNVRVAGSSGVAIAAQAWGPTDAPAVLLIHGFLGGRFSWAPLICGSLANKANLVTVELRGHGASDKPEEPSAYADSKVWADDIAAVVSALGLEQFILVAHSYGGVVAFDYLRHKGSSAVKGLVLLGAAAEPPGVSQDYFQPDTMAPLQASLSQDLSERVGGIRGFVRAISRDPLSSDLHDALIAQGAISSPSMLAGAFARPPVSNVDIFTKLDIPVAFVCGSHENVVTQALVDHVLRAAPHATSRILDNVGHLPQIEAADDVAVLIADLIESSSSS